MNTIEQDLADFILKLAPGSGVAEYERECYRLWTKNYGELVAQRVKNFVDQGRK